MLRAIKRGLDMKKFGRLFGIAVLAAATLTAGAVGLSGCGNKVSVNDISHYVTKQTTDNTMSQGFKVRSYVDGARVEGVVVFKEGDTVELGLVLEESSANTYEEVYIRGDEMFARESKTGSFMKKTVDLSDVTNDESEVVAMCKQMADLNVQIQQFLQLCSQWEGSGLKITKTDKDGMLTYKLTYKDPTGNMSFELGYKNDKIAKLSFDMNAGHATVQMRMEAFSGEIVFPEELDTNFEEVPDQGGEEGGETGGEVEEQLAA